MSIDIFNEKVLSLADAARKLPPIRDGKAIHYGSLHRWSKIGVNGPGGVVVRLEIVRIGGTTCTSQEALQRFFDTLNEQPSPPPKQVAPISGHHGTVLYSKQREMEEARVERELDIIFGENYRVFARSTAPKDTLRELHAFLYEWMPNVVGKTRAFLAIRGAVFAHAVKILEGRAGRRRSLKAAQEWILGLNLATMDVTEFDRVGPGTQADWNLLKETREVKTMLEEQCERRECAIPRT